MTHLARSTLIIAIFFGLDKVLGFVRQVFIARQFGLTYAIDVFNAANNIPDLLSALISGGALGIALIPVLSEYLAKQGRPSAWDLFARIANLAFLLTAALSLLIALLAEPLVHYLIAPGFPPEQLALTVELMRLDLIAILIFSISGLVMAGLQANQHFLFPAMAPGFYNLGQIFGAAILAPQEGLVLGPFVLPAFGLGIHGLVYGVIIGAFLHLAIQIPGLFFYQFSWKPVIGLQTPAVRRVLSLLGPRVLTMFFLQVFFIARDNIASGLGEGAITALNYGWFIMQVPETLIGTAIAVALLPTISELFAKGDTLAFTQTINRALSTILALTLPIAVLLGVAIQPLVKIAFNFDPAGVELVGWVTRAYLAGLMGHAFLEIAARSFYATQDARTPLYAAALNAGVYILLAWSLSRLLGPAGIALGNSLAFTSEALLLLFLLNRRYPGVLNLMRTGWRALAAALLGGVILFAVSLLPIPMMPLTAAALAAGSLAALPLIWPEIRGLIRL